MIVCTGFPCLSGPKIGWDFRWTHTVLVSHLTRCIHISPSHNWSANICFNVHHLIHCSIWACVPSLLSHVQFKMKESPHSMDCQAWWVVLWEVVIAFDMFHSSVVKDVAHITVICIGILWGRGTGALEKGTFDTNWGCHSLAYIDELYSSLVQILRREGPLSFFQCSGSHWWKEFTHFLSDLPGPLVSSTSFMNYIVRIAIIGA